MGANTDTATRTIGWPGETNPGRMSKSWEKQRTCWSLSPSRVPSPRQRGGIGYARLSLWIDLASGSRTCSLHVAKIKNHKTRWDLPPPEKFSKMVADCTQVVAHWDTRYSWFDEASTHRPRARLYNTACMNGPAGRSQNETKKTVSVGKNKSRKIEKDYPLKWSQIKFKGNS